MPSLETRDRRNVLNWLLGLWGGGVLGAVFYPVARYLSPPDIPEAAAVSATAGSARAQDTMAVKVPFSFLVNGHMLPAGDYTITRDNMATSVYMIRGDKGGAFVATVPAAGHDPSGNQPSLTFVRHENQYKLSTIWGSANEGLTLVGG